MHWTMELKFYPPNSTIRWMALVIQQIKLKFGCRKLGSDSYVFKTYPLDKLSRLPTTGPWAQAEIGLVVCGFNSQLKLRNNCSQFQLAFETPRHTLDLNYMCVTLFANWSRNVCSKFLSDFQDYVAVFVGFEFDMHYPNFDLG